MPLPTDTHQAILAYLYVLFRAWLKPRGGVVRFSALRMRIREGKFREPDLLLLRDRSDPRRQDRYWLGADLVVEVVSPDDPERDLVEKRTDYAEGGIPEYWIVDPRDETITVLALAGDAYVEHGVFARGGAAASARLDGFANRRVGGVRRAGDGRLSKGRRPAGAVRCRALRRIGRAPESKAFEPGLEVSPTFRCGHRSPLGDRTYSLKPLRRSVSYASNVFGPCALSQRRLGALATKVGETSRAGAGNGSPATLGGGRAGGGRSIRCPALTPAPRPLRPSPPC